MRRLRSTIVLVLAVSALDVGLSIGLASLLGPSGTCEAVDFNIRLGVCTCAMPGDEPEVAIAGRRETQGSQDKVHRPATGEEPFGRLGKSPSIRRISSEGATRNASESRTIAVKDGL